MRVPRPESIAAAAALALALSFGFAPRAEAGTALRLGFAELAGRAEWIVEGRVLGARSGELAGGFIYTDYPISLRRSFDGSALGVRTVRLPGGVLDDGRGLVLPGMPALSIGEDVLLFLSAPGREGVRMPVGLAQGKFRVVTKLAGGERVLTREQADVALLDPRTGALSTQGRTALDYGEAMAILQAELAKPRGARPEGK